MEGTHRPRVTLQRVALGAMAACAVLAVAACGTKAPGSVSLPGTARSHHPSAVTSPSSQSALCAQTATLSQVVATHTLGESTGHLHEAMPASVTLRGTASVRPLARTLCGLPLMPTGVMHCPMDTGSNYRLLFSRPGHTYPPVVVDMTGCRGVTGLGKTRTWDEASSLARTLTKALSTH